MNKNTITNNQQPTTTNQLTMSSSHSFTKRQLIDGRYQIKAILQEDGLLRTYLALDTKLPGQPQCILKLLSPVTADLFLQAKQQLQREAEMLVTVGKHPQIPKLMAYSNEQGLDYLVREYIAGVSLAEELITGQRLGESAVVRIGADLLEVLEFIHSQGLVYRDLKPDNIVRRKEDGKLVLIDFQALAPLILPSNSIHLVTGSPAYLPSEQINGEVQYSSDIYAVGIIAIQALTGVHPDRRYGGGFKRSVTGEIEWRELAIVSDGLGAVLSRMVSYDWRDRYPNATEALNALLYRQNYYTANSSSPLSTTNSDLSSVRRRWIMVSIFVLGIASTILTVLFIKWLIDLSD